ncbi:hypothetical protein CF326_g3539 [Tilletia indica]|nr:hypothetical protein CF326_g3539 [Tilletia indica]
MQSSQRTSSLSEAPQSYKSTVTPPELPSHILRSPLNLVMRISSSYKAVKRKRTRGPKRTLPRWVKSASLNKSSKKPKPVSHLEEEVILAKMNTLRIQAHPDAQPSENRGPS